MSARPPRPFGLSTKDLPGIPEPLVRELRRFSEETNSAFRALAPRGVLTVTLTAAASPTPNITPYPFSMALPFAGRCKHMSAGTGRIIAPLEQYIENAILPDWVNGDGGVVVRNLTGLMAGYTYELSFEVTGE